MAIIPHDGIPGKICKKCQEWKPLALFKGNGKSSDGYDHACRTCRGYRAIVHSERDGVVGKVCPACDTWKSLADFNKDKQKSDGVCTYCRPCDINQQRSNRQDSLDSRRAVSRQSYYRHREKRLAGVRRYRLAHLEEARASSRKRGKEHYQLYPERRKAYGHARRARERQANGEFTPKEWRDLCRHYGFACLCCGQTQPFIKLTPDHVVPLSKGGSNDIDNIQPLCLQCNLEKATKTIDYRPDRQQPDKPQQLGLFDEE